MVWFRLVLQCSSSTRLHSLALAHQIRTLWLYGVVQERSESAFKAFDAALARHHSCTTDAEQEQITAAKAQLESELSTIAAEAVQHVKAAAAAAAARKQAAAGTVSSEQEQTAESVFEEFKAQLQMVEDDCADVTAAQQACKVSHVLRLGLALVLALLAQSCAAGECQQHALSIVPPIRPRCRSAGQLTSCMRNA